MDRPLAFRGVPACRGFRHLQAEATSRAAGEEPTHGRHDPGAPQARGDVPTVAALAAPTEDGIGRDPVESRRPTTTASRLVVLEASMNPSEPWPLASRGRSRARDVRRGDRRRRRRRSSSGVKTPDQGAMPVPGTPRVITPRTCPGRSPWTQRSSVRSPGFVGPTIAAIRPSPRPSGPWQLSQREK